VETWQNNIIGETENQALLKYKLAFISPPDFSSWNPHNDRTVKYCGKVCVRGKSLGTLLSYINQWPTQQCWSHLCAGFICHFCSVCRPQVSVWG